MDKKIDYLKEIEKELLDFREKKKIFEEFMEELIPLINKIIFEKKIHFHEVIGRVKEEKSIKEKILREGFKSMSEIKDLIGIRVIAYLPSESEKICELIEEEFKIIEKKDHSQKSRGSYRGKNYIAKVDDKRSILPEYICYKDFKFEIQVTTILDHAWSEIQHDRIYKFESAPPNFKKQFKLLAYTLELLDLQFDYLCKNIDEKIKEIEQKTEKGEIGDIPLDMVSLRGYLNEEFRQYLGERLIPTFREADFRAQDTIFDLKQMGINTLGDLRKIIPLWIEEYLKAQRFARTTYADLIRDILVIQFKEDYVKKSKLFKESQAYNFSKKEDILFKAHGIDYAKLVESHGIQFIIRDD